jgi:hypothetical protein
LGYLIGAGLLLSRRQLTQKCNTAYPLLGASSSPALRRLQVQTYYVFLLPVKQSASRLHSQLSVSVLAYGVALPVARGPHEGVESDCRARCVVALLRCCVVALLRCCVVVAGVRWQRTQNRPARKKFSYAAPLALR